MNTPFHIDASKRVATFLKWPGDHNLLARSAADPDSVETIKVAGLGAHALGHNFAAFAHFCKPVADDTDGKPGWVTRGYCYNRDGSLPQIDLPTRDVSAVPAAWGFHTSRDPLSDLLDTLRGHATLAADHFTFPSAANMAAWTEARAASAQDANERTVWVGRTLHFLQDCCVPHHILGALLLGHSEFEAAAVDQYRAWVADGVVDALIAAATKLPAPVAPVLARNACEAAALDTRISISKLRFYLHFWRVGWNELISASIRRALFWTTQYLRSV